MRSTAKTLGAAAATAGLLAGSFLLGAGEASADWSDCRDGAVCIYTGSDGSEGMWEVPGCGFHVLPQGIKDQVSSVKVAGNAIVLRSVGVVTLQIQQWNEYNIHPMHNDTADEVTVEC